LGNVLKIEKQGFEIYEIGITETDEVKILQVISGKLTI
jgi:hypothetical protein